LTSVRCSDGAALTRASACAMVMVLLAGGLHAEQGALLTPRSMAWRIMVCSWIVESRLPLPNSCSQSTNLRLCHIDGV
jgi:hypothetical protein